MSIMYHKALARFDEVGASLAEYALLVLLIAIVAIVAVVVAGKEISTQYSNISSAMQGASG